jgi:hypothetical protein
VGADEGHDTRGVQERRDRNVRAHLSKNTNRIGRAAPLMGARHDMPVFRSQRKRKRIEEVFGWLQTGGTAQDATPRGLQSESGVHFCCRLQSEADEEPGVGSVRIGSRRRVLSRRKSGDSGIHTPRKCSSSALARTGSFVRVSISSSY